jgi:hypothetical protein
MPLRTFYEKTNPEHRQSWQPDDEDPYPVARHVNGANKIVWAVAASLSGLFIALLVWNLKSTFELTGDVRELRTWHQYDRSIQCSIARKLDIPGGCDTK